MASSKKIATSMVPYCPASFIYPGSLEEYRQLTSKRKADSELAELETKRPKPSELGPPRRSTRLGGPKGGDQPPNKKRQPGYIKGCKIQPGDFDIQDDALHLIDPDDFDSFEEFERMFPPFGEWDNETVQYRCRVCGKGHRGIDMSRRHYQKRHLGATSACRLCGQVLFGPESAAEHHYVAHVVGICGFTPCWTEISVEQNMYISRKLREAKKNSNTRE
ncbi:hypothetical protein F4810DRAFT_712204 [Camillea tinctor]|nr:hypothetical protein F4810DRAFT_712204 [Camillea tinctor]